MPRANLEQIKTQLERFSTSISIYANEENNREGTSYLLRVTYTPETVEQLTAVIEGFSEGEYCRHDYDCCGNTYFQGMRILSTYQPYPSYAPSTQTAILIASWIRNI